MPHIDISTDLFQKIQQNLSPSGSVDDFVRSAIEARLADQGQRDEFFRLTDETRRRMLDQGLTEEGVLVDFELQRRGDSAP